MRRIPLLVLSAVLTTPVFAQTSLVVPATAATVEGNAISSYPFAFDQIRTTQYYGASVLGGIPSGKQITELAYRRDGEALRTTLLQRTTTPNWEIRMGHYGQDAKSPSNAYLGPGTGTGDTLLPVYNQITTFPGLPGGNGPMDFLIVFKLDRPFTYLGGGLAVDHYAYETSGRTFSYYVDAVRGSIDTGGFVNYGTSCPSGENRASAIPSNPGGEPFSLLLFGAPANSVALAILGASRTAWGAFQLPVDLTVLGLPSCSLYASIDFMPPVPVFSTGSANLTVPMPNDPGLSGARLFAQWMVLDPRVNPSVPLAFSNGVEITFGKSLGNQKGVDGAVLYGVGGLARNRYGFVDSGVMLVTRFTYL